MINPEDMIDKSFFKHKSRLKRLKNKMQNTAYKILFKLILKVQYRQIIINDLITYVDFKVADSIVERNKKLISKEPLGIPADTNGFNRPEVSLEKFSKMANEAEVQLPPEKIAHVK